MGVRYGGVIDLLIDSSRRGEVVDWDHDRYSSPNGDAFATLVSQRLVLWTKPESATRRNG